eukprot:CAMPEP_0118867326 /NCGR_PEP_ID=MMETSP1163-20130328/10965_1 /TAXON_ID=124430 /ORGANISM="Phaeomonas parva, Strain CCMP2877" /LENGTH=1002 /DNA_ID=CAMNT_0006801727 /DNA_START=77 /DNA_END=3081 /DNA_ORIENTATION=-
MAAPALGEALDAARKFIDATLRGRQDHWEAMRENAAELATLCMELFEGDDAEGGAAQLLVDQAVRLLQRLREVREPRNPRAAEHYRGSRAFYRGACAMLLTLNQSLDNPSDTMMALSSFAQSGMEILSYSEAKNFALALFRNLRDTLNRCNLELLEQRVARNDKEEILTRAAAALEAYADAVYGATAVGLTEQHAAEIVGAVNLLKRVLDASKGDTLRLAYVAHYHGRKLCGEAGEAGGEDGIIEHATDCLRTAMDACESCTSAEAKAAEISALQAKILFALCYCFAERNQPERAIICLTNLEKMSSAGESDSGSFARPPENAIRADDVQLARCFVFTRCNDLQSAMTATQQLIRDYGNWDYAIDAIRKFSVAANFDQRATLLLEELQAKFNFEPKLTEVKLEMALNLLKSKGAADAEVLADDAAKIMDEIYEAGGIKRHPESVLKQIRRALWLWTSHLKSLELGALVNEWCTRVLRFIPKPGLTMSAAERDAIEEEIARAHLWKSAALLDLSQTDAALAHAKQAFEAQANEASLIGVFFAAAHTPRVVEELVADVKAAMSDCHIDTFGDKRALFMALIRISNSMKINPSKKFDILLQLLASWLTCFIGDAREAGAVPTSADTFGLMLRSMLKAALMKVDTGHHGELLYLKGSPETLRTTLEIVQECCVFLGQTMRERTPENTAESTAESAAENSERQALSGTPLEALGTLDDFEYATTVLWNVAYTAAAELERGREQRQLDASKEVDVASVREATRLVQSAFCCTAELLQCMLDASRFRIDEYRGQASNDDDEGAMDTEEPAAAKKISEHHMGMLKRLAQALAAAITLSLEIASLPDQDEEATTSSTQLQTKLAQLEELSALLLAQSTDAADALALKMRDLCVALRLDAATTTESIDAFLNANERVLFSMPPVLLLSMTDRLAARHTLPLESLYRLYRLCHQLVVRNSHTQDKSILLRVFTNLFRFAASNDTSLQILDEVVQVCMGGRARSGGDAPPPAPG